MKQIARLAFIALAITTVMVACGPKSDLPGYKKTESGLHYQFIKENKKAQQVQMDDALVCEVILTLDEDTLYNNTGNPERLLQATDAQFYGSIEEGLLMLHKGDEAIFAVDADSVANYHNMPGSYTPGKRQKLYYHIKLDDIVTADSLAKAEALFLATMSDLQKAEPAKIEQYIQQNNIKAVPDEDGLYVVINKKGTGKKISVGSRVAFNYTGRLTDGTIFDSNVQSVAEEAGIYDSRRNYAPEEFVMGQSSYVKGLLLGMIDMQKGTNATLIIPSKLGYGSIGRGGKIGPYCPLVFDIEIVSVN